MAKKSGGPPRAEKDRSERWLLTYADLITLLLVFFIVLYTMSQVDKKKFEAMSASLAVVFGGVGKSGVLDAGRSIMPGDKIYKERLEMQNTQEKVRRMIAQRGLEGKISTDLGERGLVISVKDTVLFDVGSGELTPAARDIMQNVAHLLSETPSAIRVEGHTDNVPIRKPTFPSNWELSAARAASVVRLLAAGGVAPSRLAVLGLGEFRPAASNDTPAGRDANRRVLLVILGNDAAPEGDYAAQRGSDAETPRPGPQEAVAPGTAAAPAPGEPAAGPTAGAAPPATATATVPAGGGPAP
jgi:chemotaxis protein MotB